ncbi:MAG: DUF2290 domain-containing protein [Acidimicrobiales bacterium]
MADDQNYPFERKTGATTFSIRFTNVILDTSPIRDVPYVDTYMAHNQGRIYNIKMLDGALIQMSFDFDDDVLIKYRLAFLPSPDLLEFQNYPEVYLNETLYADVVERRVVTVPVRFDFDSHSAASLVHPASHLTLGQYSGCRIPTVAPLTPSLFVEFLLRSFYNTASFDCVSTLPSNLGPLPGCITDEERSIVHVGVPSSN